MPIPYGSLANAFAIVLGTFVGLFFGQKLSKSLQTLLYQGIGLCLLMLGFQMCIPSKEPLLVIVSIIGGLILGELCQLEMRLMRLGSWLRERIRSKNPAFSNAFINASVLFCVGAMGIMGAFDEGLRGDRTILYSKAVLDGIISMIMASSMGFGVLFSSVVVFLYQGLLTIFASSIHEYFSPAIMTELVATGGIIVLGIGLNLLQITQIALSNMIPALCIIVVLAQFFIH